MFQAPLCSLSSWGPRFNSHQICVRPPSPGLASTPPWPAPPDSTRDSPRLSFASLCREQANGCYNAKYLALDLGRVDVSTDRGRGSGWKPSLGHRALFLAPGAGALPRNSKSAQGCAHAPPGPAVSFRPASSGVPWF